MKVLKLIAKKRINKGDIIYINDKRIQWEK